ncbi:MAG: hypothetical protein WA040_22115 [Anaerolineae bacterium]
MSSFFPTLLAFALLVMLLYWLQRWISQHLQGVGILLFSSSNAGMALLWFVLLPGVLLHEGSHWLMAKLLGVPTGRLRLSPSVQGKQVVLGSVEVKRTDPVRDSLVGLAPFLAGTLALLAIGYWVFDAASLGLAWQRGAWNQIAELLLGAFQIDDAALWLYLIFAVSNAMMPSPSDRESWRLVLVYLAVVAAVMLVFGWLPSLPASMIDALTGGLRTLTYAFALALLIDLVFAAALALLELLLSALRRSKVVYK